MSSYANLDVNPSNLWRHMRTLTSMLLISDVIDKPRSHTYALTSYSSACAEDGFERVGGSPIHRIFPVWGLFFMLFSISSTAPLFENSRSFHSKLVHATLPSRWTVLNRRDSGVKGVFSMSIAFLAIQTSSLDHSWYVVGRQFDRRFSVPWIVRQSSAVDGRRDCSPRIGGRVDRRGRSGDGLSRGRMALFRGELQLEVVRILLLDVQQRFGTHTRNRVLKRTEAKHQSHGIRA